jgi:hypothetical protein
MARRGGREAWAASFGEPWPLDLAVMAVVVFCFGAVRPLSDPDLPMHLAVGEWIVQHRAVPFAEPFAWTRAGAPYYAYSWLPQALFYLVLDTFGHVGLRALQGLVVVASAASAIVLARAAGWRPSQAIMLAGFNLIVAAFFVAALRPQSVLLITVPVVWAGFYWIGRGSHFPRAALVLFLASALTANSHLFFPITLAPAALLLVYPIARRRDALIGVASVLAGWLTSPYSLRWLDVFRHNFAPNPLFRPPAAITELQPGFVTMLHPEISALFLVVVGMLTVPWVVARAPLGTRERVMAAAYWCMGLILFGYAARLFIAWWLLAIVPVGRAMVHLTRDTEDAPPRLRFRLLGLGACVVIITTAFVKSRGEWAMEGDTTTRTLPTVGARSSEPLAAWLLRNTAPGSRGRLMTTFANGSYLTWRLPGYSASLDSRGVFPDSVSAAESVVLATDRDVPLGPWRSADAAVLPIRYRVAAVLDTASGWRRVASAPGFPQALDSTALWVRETWWNDHRRSSPTP